MGLTGIGYSGTQIFPYSVMGLMVPDPRKKGLAMGTLTICIVVPQMVDVAFVGVVAERWDMSAVVAIGGCFATLAAVGTAFVRLPGNEGDASDNLVAADHQSDSQAASMHKV